MTQVPAGPFTTRCSDGSQPNSRRRAFNLLEMLVVMLLVGLFAAMTYTSLASALPRTKLRTKATEVSGLLQSARLNAIKLGMDVTVQVEDFGGEMFLTATRVNTRPPTVPPAKPEPPFIEVARVYAGAISRPFDPYLAGVDGGLGDNAKINTFKDEVLVYSKSGNASGVGAFRLSIGQANKRNTIEVAVTSLGGHPVVRKYIKAANRPVGAPVGQEFFEETHYGSKWEWTWY